MTEEKTNKKLDAKQELGDISDLRELPATAFNTEPGNKRISQFLQQQREGLIEYPKMQRNSVWTVTDQSELIESLIRGIPIPPIYMNKFIENGKQVWEVLDGRQRLTALFDFFENNTVRINSNLPKKYENLAGYRFKEIVANNPLFAGKFEEIPLPIVWLDEAPEQLKKEFFQKLNKGGKALTTGELAHSSLDPALRYLVRIMETHFYESHVHKTQRFAEYVPASKVLHFILKSMQDKTQTFMYNSQGTKTWKDNIVTNTTAVQTDLDNLHEHRNEKFVPCLDAEIERVCTLIDTILGDVEIASPNNKLISNILLSLLILEDTSNPEHMTHEELKQSYQGLVALWNKGHLPRVVQKRKTNLADITMEESLLFNECDKLESASKINLDNVLENLKDDTYSEYAG